jgi:signal transduction histidine kinase
MTKMSQTSLNGILPRFWRTIASALLGCILLALVIFVCFQLHTRLGIVALFCLLTIVILSLQGRFFVALFCSVLATLGLDYFFTQPVFSLAVTRPEDIAALLTFLAIALVVSALGSKLRKSYWELAQENTERKRAEEELREKEASLREAQSSLAHVSRLTMMGELAVSIAHEVNQPLTAILNNANACLAQLPSETKDLDELSAALSDIVSDAHRASAVIARIRELVEKVPPQKSRLNINATIGEVIALARGELDRHGVLLQTSLADDSPSIMGDRIQLQQVILNLIINAIEAMSGVTEGPRELLVSSEKVTAVPTPADAGEQARFEPDTSVYPESSAFEGLAKEEGLTPNTSVLVSVADSGPGLDALDHLFDAFYTTKPQGLGMGLSISRSIVKAHGGRLWAMTNVPKGALFQFTLPIGAE